MLVPDRFCMNVYSEGSRDRIMRIVPVKKTRFPWQRGLREDITLPPTNQNRFARRPSVSIGQFLRLMLCVCISRSHTRKDTNPTRNVTLWTNKNVVTFEMERQEMPCT